MRAMLLGGALICGMAIQAVPGQAAAASLSVQGADAWRADVLTPFDVRLGEVGPGGVRRVSVAVDRAALLHELPSLQKHGALSNGITGDDVTARPASYTNVLSLLLTSYAVRDLYAAHPDVGVTRSRVSAAPNGGHEEREMFFFTFDRAPYKRVDWDRLVFTDFPRVAAGFSHNLRFTLEISHEVDGTIADD